METRVGTCGWSFEDWRGPFYPPGTKDELVYYAGQFSAVEIDSTWYHIPSRKTVESWRRRSPEGFVFCPKLPGEITHENLLEDSEDLVRTFMETMSLLQDKLGGILVQLSPKFTADNFATLRGFLTALPDAFRYAVEFRHRSWVGHEKALSLLTDLKMAVVMADHPWYPRMEHTTCDFTYLRLLGRRGALPDYTKIHRARQDHLDEWASLLRGLPKEVTRAFVFINNQFEGHSPITARKLLAMLGEEVEDPRMSPPPQEGQTPRLLD